MSWKHRKFKGFFRPKLGDLQKKKKTKKKRSSPKFRAIFRPKSEIQTFFPPKIRWSPKKKKKRSSPKFRVIFRPKSEIQTFFPPKIRWSPKKKKKKKKKKKGLRQNSEWFFSQVSQVQTSEGGLFSYGEGYFPFFTVNRPQKHKIHAFLHTSHAPPLATLLCDTIGLPLLWSFCTNVVLMVLSENCDFCLEKLNSLKSASLLLIISPSSIFVCWFENSDLICFWWKGFW